MEKPDRKVGLEDAMAALTALAAEKLPDSLKVPLEGLNGKSYFLEMGWYKEGDGPLCLEVKARFAQEARGTDAPAD